MKHFIATLTTLLLAVPYVAAEVCDITETLPTNKNMAFVTVQPNFPKGVTRTVKGNVQLVDGCTFRVSDFTISPPGLDTYFYGIPKGQPIEEDSNGNKKLKLIPRIVAAKLGSYNGQDATFKLDNSPAANAGLGGVGFDDLDGIAIYTAADDKIFAKVLWARERDLDSSSSRLGFPVLALISVLAYIIF